MKFLILSLLFSLSALTHAVGPNDKYPLTYLDMLVNRSDAIAGRMKKPPRVEEAYFGLTRPTTLKVEVMVTGSISAVEKQEIETFYNELIMEEAKDLAITGTKIKVEIFDLIDPSKVEKAPAQAAQPAQPAN
ncbi:hypothetical protein A9Q84_19210 [Halobacteriovorax marinus]|uniref:Uncharacterized protein n=1 Tax=Halobacteriovorax marinus TaxID=97084 RepID=A0A1Y5F6C2_9BACT|nr:hypothetical protein A9Q84_19210 [Halobacteriovorax marinus]